MEEKESQRKYHKVEQVDIVEAVLLEHYDKYYRIAFQYMGNKEDALDVVQESVYKAIVYSSKLKQTEYADTWICRIVINEAKTQLSKKKREIGNDFPEEEAANDIYQDMDLQRAMDHLSQEERLLIQLHYYEDMTLADVARTLEMNVNTVKTKIYRTLDKLGLEMKE